MRVAFFGLPIAAILLANDGHDVVWAGICRSGAPGTRRLRERIGAPRVHIAADASSPRAMRGLEDSRPDVVVSWFWTKKIPPHVLRLAPAFGVHPSLLPRHRGPDPYFWAIDCGDGRTGVTAHMLDEQYDTGDILGQSAIDLDPRWDAGRLARVLDRPSLSLLRDVARAFAAGRPPARQPQNDRLATMAPDPSDEDLAVRWSWPAARLARRVLAAAPWPGAWTEIAGRVVTLVRVRPTLDYPRALEPGEAAVRADGTGVVRTGDDAIELVEGRGEDDEPLQRGHLAALVDAARGLSIAETSAVRFDRDKEQKPCPTS